MSKEAIQKAAKIHDDPALRAIQELGDSVATSFEVLETEQKAATAKIGADVQGIREDLDRTRTEMTAGFKVHQDKINTLDRRSVALGIGSPASVEGRLLAVLEAEERAWLPAIEASIPKKLRERRGEFPIMGTAAGSAALTSLLWYYTMKQKMRFPSRAHEAKVAERIEKIETAFYEAYGYEKAAAFTTVTEGLGGSFLPDPVSQEFRRLILDHSIIAALCTHVPMTTKTLDLPIEGSSTLTVDWGTEGSAITDSVPSSNATSKLTLTAARLNGRAVSSIEELMDSPISILDWVRTKLIELCGREIDQECLEGGQFSGLLGTSGVNEITAGANGDAVTYQYLVDMVFKARERATRDGAGFAVSPELMAKIVGLVDSQGMPVVQFGNVPNAFQASLLGYPVHVHSAILANRTKGTGTTLSHAYFGPWKQIVIGDRVGMAWDVSDAPGFTTAQVHMRLMMRLAIGVAVPAAFTRRLHFVT